MSKDNFFEEPKFRQVDNIDKVGKKPGTTIEYKQSDPIPMQKHAGGRPTKYKEEYVDEIKGACLLNSGITDEQIASKFYISLATLYEWKKLYPEFSEAIAFGKVKADEMVANSLFSLTQKRRKNVQKVFISKGNPVVIDSYEELEPDVKACQLWLNNRRPKEWRNAATDGDTSVHILVDTQTQDSATAWLSAPKSDDESQE